MENLPVGQLGEVAAGMSLARVASFTRIGQRPVSECVAVGRAIMPQWRHITRPRDETKNGTTLTGATLANKHNLSYETKEGKVEPNFFGSVTQTSTVYIGGAVLIELIELTKKHEVFIAGDDFKSGLTKFKSVLVDFSVSAGIKAKTQLFLTTISTTTTATTFERAQAVPLEGISKSSVVDDMANGLKKSDHCVVIKYVPHVADSKRALDEYVSELMLGGKNTIVAHNTCEDSHLAAPLILDLVLIAELCERVTFKINNPEAAATTTTTEFQKFNAVLAVLFYLCNAPLVERGARVVNALFKQRSSIGNLLRALDLLPPINHMDFEFKLSKREQWYEQVAAQAGRSRQVVELDASKLADANGVVSEPPKGTSGY